MVRYFLYNLYSGVDTFSTFPAGDEFSFDTSNFNPHFTFLKDDIIVCYSNPGLFYVLKVVDINLHSIKIYKALEFYNDNFIAFDSGINIKEITGDEFNKIVNDFISTILLNDIQNTTIDNTTKENRINLIDDFAKWLNQNPKHNYYENDYEKTRKGLEIIEAKYFESFGTTLFNIDINNYENIIKEIETNIWNESTDFWSFSSSTSNHRPRAILNKDNYQAFLRIFAQENSSILGFNKIYFGPPGTGKSYAIKEYLKDNNVNPKNYSRVTFHPDYDYHSFVGGYKPYTDINDAGKIKYEFVPQIFTDLYVKAWENKELHYYLVIEEINRGNCAEIFGDIFQLLDRNPEYNIEPSSELREYLVKKEEEINKENEQEGKEPISLLHNGKLQMPNNLSILASMNTSDQSLYPMDSAFKRRWEWEYVKIDTKCTNSNFTIEINDNAKYSWLEFLESVNQSIYNVTKSEDKQIGNWFINAKQSDNIISKDLFINKVLFYLWNDVFKDEAFHSDNIFIEKDDDGSKKRDISFNHFYNEERQEQSLIHLFEKVLGIENKQNTAPETVPYEQTEESLSNVAESPMNLTDPE